VYTDRDYTNFEDSLVYIGRYSTIDYKALAGANTFAQLIEALRDTEYYSYLLPLKGKEQQEGQFGIEMALDLAYFNLFERHIKLLPKNEQTILREIQGMQVDLLNLQWIYRGLKFYKLSPEELLNYTIGFGSRLKYKDIKELCYSKDIKELERRMLNSRYRFLFTHELTKDVFMERRILRYQYSKLMELRRRGDMNISQTIIYSQLLEYEMRDIISVIEAVRYNIHDVQQVKRYLIRKI
jgi:V/A-type H+-transporting ATPase subunit C